jgi:hypothetical protein
VTSQVLPATSPRRSRLFLPSPPLSSVCRMQVLRDLPWKFFLLRKSYTSKSELFFFPKLKIHPQKPSKNCNFQRHKCTKNHGHVESFSLQVLQTEKRRTRRRWKVGSQLVEASFFSQAKTMSQPNETSHCLITHAKSRKNQCPLPSSSSQTQLQEHGEVFLVVLVTILRKYYCC